MEYAHVHFSRRRRRWGQLAQVGEAGLGEEQGPGLVRVASERRLHLLARGVGLVAIEIESGALEADRHVLGVLRQMRQESLGREVEVLALDQDALGRQATCVINHGDVRIYEKDLEDGGRAVGFFNLGAAPVALPFNEFTPLGLAGKQNVRDLWRQKDVATADPAKDSLRVTIPAHGVVLYKFTAAK